MERKGYIKVQVEQQYPDDYEPTTITVNSPQWDMDMFKLMEIFHGIAMTMTYSDTAFKNAMIEYLADHYNVEVPEGDDEDDK